MKICKAISLAFIFTVLPALYLAAQGKGADTTQQATEKYLLQQKEQQVVDSMVTVQLQKELGQAAAYSAGRKQLEERLKELATRDSVRKAQQLQRITELKQKAIGHPVALLTDTLFYIYTGIGSFSSGERANAISQRINNLYDDAGFKADSLEVVHNETTDDIVYNNDNTIMSVTNLDALWFNQTQDSLAHNYLLTIKKQVIAARQANSFANWVKRFAYSLLIVFGIGLIVFIINRLFKRSVKAIYNKKEQYFNGITLKKINLLSAEQHLKFALRINNILRIVVIVLAIYLALPLFFGIFPQTKFFANLLWAWVTTPAKAVVHGFINFLPNLFTIVVIYMVFHYIVKLVKYFSGEIERGAITLSGFHADWATPTFNIIRFIIYAFMFVIIFPYLPGSKSPAFQGVSVFLGLLISLGSGSAISNIVSGLVITYMRPFKKGDRVKIGEITGDVIEKTMLVTRIRTIKNEDITVPNSTVLSSHTINYSANTNDVGLIVHTTVTIGYDVPWKEMHQALIDAALQTELILKEPKPFVLQTSLDDFYVSYQINAYTKEANKQAVIYSNLHQNIQDVCNERGIEIMSPHYNAMRDGNAITIPASYLAKDYKAPAFNVNLNNPKDS